MTRIWIQCPGPWVKLNFFSVLLFGAGNINQLIKKLNLTCNYQGTDIWLVKFLRGRREHYYVVSYKTSGFPNFSECVI